MEHLKIKLSEDENEPPITRKQKGNERWRTETPSKKPLETAVSGQNEAIQQIQREVFGTDWEECNDIAYKK